MNGGTEKWERSEEGTSSREQSTENRKGGIGKEKKKAWRGKIEMGGEKE